ncbi:MAG TPA: TIGR03617 family F420-dependent LLM class oxidoreductase [Terriglobales bacterium]
MKLDAGLLAPDLKSVPAFARAAEEAGYAGLWSFETQHEAFLPLAVAATVTSRITLGTSIAVAFPRSPMITAHTAWDLAQASDGRFILGLGSQVKAHNERRFSVKFESPAPKLREYVLALRAIWECWQNGTPLKFEGEFYKFTLMTPFFSPGPIAHPKIPVFIAGVNHLMCRVAGEVCDGLHVHPFHSPKYIREYVLPAVAEGLKTSGRTRDAFTLASSCFVIVGDTDSERAQMAEEVRQQISFYASTRTYEPVLAAHGWEALTAELHRKSLQGDWKGMTALVTDEMLDTFAVSGSWEDIGAKLRARYEGLLNRVALYAVRGESPLENPRRLRFVREFNA